MDTYLRFVFRAFGVPDVLAEENQLKAASAALLRTSGIDTDPQSELPWQLAAQAYVEMGATLLREHQIDAAIGNYTAPFPHDTGVRGAVSELQTGADARARELSGGDVPAEESQALASSFVETVVTWAHTNPDGLRELSR